jgi:hypothetical protein
MPRMITWSGSGSFIYPWNTRSVPDGRYEIEVIARDAAGNTRTVTQLVTVANGVILDTQKPVVIINAPLAGAVTGAVPIEALCTDNVEIASVQMYVNGALIRSFNGAGNNVYAHTWASSSVPNGNHTISVVATDSSGNTQTASRVVTVNNSGTSDDTTLPSVAITQPLPSAEISGIYEVQFTVSDNVALRRIEIYIDEILVRTYETFAGESHTYSWNTQFYPNGTHVLRIVAIDTSGNSRSQSVTVTTDNEVLINPPPIDVSQASNWMIAIFNAETRTLKSIHGWAGGQFQFSDIGTRQTQLGRIKTAIRMIFNNVATPLYYNCVEATWTGFIPDMNDLDLVVIYTTGHRDGETPDIYYPRFSGRAESPGAPDRAVRENDDVQYRIVGLLEDATGATPSNNEHQPGVPLSLLTRNFISTHKPIACTGQYVPDIGTHELDKVYNANYNDLITILESIKAKFEKLGYTIHYGINGARVFYFMPVDNSDSRFQVDEKQLTDRIEWPERITQDYFNQVRWLIADANIPTLFNPKSSSAPTLLTPDTLSHISDSGEGPYDKVKPVNVPSDLVALKPIPVQLQENPTPEAVGYEIVRGELLKSFGTSAIQDGTATLSRIADGFPFSYAQVKQDTGTGIRFSIRIRFGADFRERDIVALKLRVKSSVEGESLLDGWMVAVGVESYDPNTDTEYGQTDIYVSQDTPDVDGYFLVGDRARNQTPASSSYCRDLIVSINTFSPLLIPPTFDQEPITFNIEDLRVFVLDADELDAQAAKEYSLPKSTSFRASKLGQKAFQPRVELIRADGLNLGVMTPDAYEMIIAPEIAVRTYALMGDGALYGFKGAASKRAAARDGLAKTKAVSSILKGVR